MQCTLLMVASSIKMPASVFLPMLSYFDADNDNILILLLSGTSCLPWLTIALSMVYGFAG